MIEHKIVESARTFLGTPWRHQGVKKGVAVDCIGLMTEVARETGCTGFEQHEPYGPTPDGHRLRREMEARADLIWENREGPPDFSKFRDGDVALMAWRVYPMHVGFIARDPVHGVWNLIHCHAQVGKVVEHRLDNLWLNRLYAVFRFREG